MPMTSIDQEHEPVTRPSASTVCEPCKKRKKSCNKALPACSRCSRLSANCYYVELCPENAPTKTLPPLQDVVPEYLKYQSIPSSESWNEVPASSIDSSVEGQVSAQAFRLLAAISRKRGPISDFIAIYFRTFHRSLPVLSPELFPWNFQDVSHAPSPHFSTLLLAIFLATELGLAAAPGDVADANAGPGELYRTLKSMFALLQSTSEVSVELVQAGVIIAGYEHCQALHREAWLTIGGCARMGNVLGLHLSLKEWESGKEMKEEWEVKRCLWWGIVVLERVINSEYEEHKLPFASQAPAPDDILPLVPLEGTWRVIDDLLMPDMVDCLRPAELEWKFTRLGYFASTVQATYLSTLVTQHIQSKDRYPDDVRREEAIKLDRALQAFSFTLIPPPGKAEGTYCGSYWMRTNAAFSLHWNELEVETKLGSLENMERAKLSLRSLARTVIDMTKLAEVGEPLDLNTMSFWSHSNCYLGAMAHVKLGLRNSEWKEDLEVLKRYIRLLEPRYRLHAKYLRKIEEAEISSYKPDPELQDVDMFEKNGKTNLPSL